jgi:lipopolysaccharide export LptBFGC system permease protein LptF
MKRILIASIILAMALSASAGENDSILLQRVDVLKKEVGALKKQNQNLQARVSQLQKSHQKDLDETHKKQASTDEAIGTINATTTDLEQSIKESGERAMDSVTILGKWTRKMLTVLAVIAVVLFAILLILVLANRKRILGDYTKLEAKVDNTRESVEKQIRDVLKQHEEDIRDLKTLVEKGKK